MNFKIVLVLVVSTATVCHGLFNCPLSNCVTSYEVSFWWHC